MVIARPHNFYGPRAGYDHIIPDTIDRAIKKINPFPIYGEQEKRSYCYIDDAIVAMKLIMESSKTDGSTYHISSYEEAKPAYIAESIFTAIGWHPSKFEHHDSPQGSVKRRLADISKIYNDVAWEPSTPLQDGIEKTVSWYVTYTAQKKPL